jgi:DnaK suppressor protein
MREKKKQKKKVLQQKKEIKKTILLKFIEECKQKLLRKYEELSNLQKSSADILFEEKGDEADIADSVLGKEMTQELSDTQRKILDLIVLALDKINKGTYGICENCGKVIEKKRLSILPWVRYCVKCQNNIEK